MNFKFMIKTFPYFILLRFKNLLRKKKKFNKTEILTEKIKPNVFKQAHLSLKVSGSATVVKRQVTKLFKLLNISFLTFVS